MKTETDTYTTLIESLLVLILIIPSILFQLFIISIFWKWFLVPFGLSPITLIQAFGFSLVKQAFFPVFSSSKEKPIKQLLIIMFYYGFLLGIGSIVHFGYNL